MISSEVRMNMVRPVAAEYPMRLAHGVPARVSDVDGSNKGTAHQAIEKKADDTIFAIV